MDISGDCQSVGCNSPSSVVELVGTNLFLLVAVSLPEHTIHSHGWFVLVNTSLKEIFLPTSMLPVGSFKKD